MGFSRANAYKFLNREDLPVVRIGGRKYLHADLFKKWLASQAISSKETDHEPH